MKLNFTLIFDSMPFLLQGAGTTVLITIFSLLLGLIIGLFMGIGRISKNPIARIPATIYVQFLRGTPLLVQIFILYFGLPSALNINLNPYVAGILALGLNSGDRKSVV